MCTVFGPLILFQFVNRKFLFIRLNHVFYLFDKLQEQLVDFIVGVVEGADFSTESLVFQLSLYVMFFDVRILGEKKDFIHL